MSKQVVKPFFNYDEWTMTHNIIIDDIMPKLSGSAWKVLTVIIRKTKGWHKECDEVSFSQIKQLTGVNSNTTISKALKDLEEMGVIKVDRPDLSGDDPARFWKSNIYSLNLDFEIEVEVKDPSPKNGLPPQSKKWTTPSPENEQGVVQKMDTQKKEESLNKDLKEIAAVVESAAAAPEPFSEKKEAVTSPVQEITDQLEAVQTAKYHHQNPPPTPYPPADGPPEEVAFTQVCRLYQAEIGKMSPLIAGEIRQKLRRCPPAWFEQAISKAAAANARRWNYIKSILTAWEKCGGPEKDRRNGVVNGAGTNGTHRQTIAGLKYSTDRYEKRSNLTTGETYYWDRVDKCRVASPPAESS